MALPRYQNVGVEVAGGIRGLDFPNRGEATRGIDTISAVLDKMSDSFFKEAATAATAEGEKYGAQNAPTQEQLKQAIESGTPLPPVGDSRTYFGKAAEKAYGDVLTTQIQYAARADIAKVKSDAESGAIGVNAIIPKINSVINGYSGALANVDPALAKKVEAQLAYEGNNAFLSASKKAASSVGTALKQDAVEEITNIIDGIKDIVPLGSVIDAATGEVKVTLDQRLEHERNRVITEARKLGKPSYVERAMKTFDKAKEVALQGTVVEWASSIQAIEGDRIYQLRNGQIEDPAVREIWNNSSPTQRNKLLESSMARAKQNFGFDATLRQMRNNAIKDASEKASNDFYVAFQDGDENGMNAALATLKPIDGTKYNKLQNFVDKANQTDDQDILREMTISYGKGELTVKRITDNIESQLITAKTGKTWLQTLKKEDNVAFQNAISYARNNSAVGYYDEIFPERGKKKLAKITNELRDELQVNPTTNPMEFVKSRILAISDDVDNVVDRQSSGILNEFASKNGLKPKDGAYKITDIDRKLREIESTLSFADAQRYTNALKELKATLSRGKQVPGFSQ
jgi:hypothetical protein